MRRLALVLIVVTAGCGSSQSSTPTTPTTPSTPSSAMILVYGSDMGPRYEHIGLETGGQSLTGAQVTVNGTVIPETSAGSYNGQLPSMLAPGAPLTLEVHANGEVVTATATIPEIPVLVTPMAGGSIHLGTPLSFSWTDGSNPDEFLAGIGYQTGAGGSAQEVTVSGSTRTTTVATAAIPAGATTLTAYVFAYANGTFSGPADPASRLHIREPTQTVSLVIQP